MVRITSDVEVASVDGVPLLVDTLWAAARARDRVEHISVRARKDRIDIGVFAIAPDRAAACAVAYDVVTRALAMSPRLRRWTVAPAARRPTAGF